jgi:ABC-type dipeptide/oligopeptide/nickel transport system permease subunit
MNLSAEMFEPQPADKADTEIISRPGSTYYGAAMMRFRQNRAGLACSTILALLITTALLGPLFFPRTHEGMRYENIPNLNYQNQGPTAGELLLVLDDDWRAPEALIRTSFNAAAPLLSSEKIPPPANLGIEGQSTVEGVTLRWEPMEGISGYEVYRVASGKDDIDINKLKTGASLGMQLGRIDNPAQYSFTDSMGLDPSEHYGYSLLPFVHAPETNEIARGKIAAAIKTGVIKTIKLSDAKSIDVKARPGKSIRGRTFLFGTDSLGRDIFARILAGARVNLALVFIVPTLCLLIGLVYGSTLGLIGGKVDLVFMRVLEVLDALPALLLMIILQLALGKGLLSLIISMSLFGWTGFARIVRGEALRLRETEFVHASRLLGASLPRIVLKHIAPNLAGIVFVVWASCMPGVIISEAFLSLLGLGLEPPAASWGMVLNDAAKQFQSYPAQFLLPCSFVAGIVLAFFVFADTLGDAFNPKSAGE